MELEGNEGWSCQDVTYNFFPRTFNQTDFTLAYICSFRNCSSGLSGWQFVVYMEQDIAQDGKSLNSLNLLTAALQRRHDAPDITLIMLLLISPQCFLANLITDYFLT